MLRFSSEFGNSGFKGVDMFKLVTSAGTTDQNRNDRLLLKNWTQQFGV